MDKYNAFTHLCYFQTTGWQQPPSSQALPVHHYISLQLLHENNQSNLPTLHNMLQILLLYKHTYTLKQKFSLTKAQNESASTLSVDTTDIIQAHRHKHSTCISPPKVQRSK
jgi:hypothetical protein